jgi:hypothetical protein
MTELTPTEALLKQIEEGLTPAISDQLRLVREHIAAQYTKERSETVVTAELERLDAAEPMRWLAMAKTDFQTALMNLTRAVVQPTTL